MLASLLVLIDLHTVEDICYNSNPGVAQQTEDDGMPLVVERGLTAGVVES